ncbi:dihydrofolate reductase family protein [Sphingomonas sp. QA11]|uniref:dihydrofolate reductase family protein n=1 Tax=Sphingomonas sp. QA11 TaxID=2950605 RepID=UPI002349C332|nr:dihydrofolate reductase family protein [Sphingomonas sp. QA11]WCM25229.1 dihydrofolate reductase family protein [Sphingomonas sp. QA11]
MMSRVRVGAFSISVDGFGAGPDQSLENPLGLRGKELHEWAFATTTFRTMFGQQGGSTGVDEAHAARSMEGMGAWIMGRNMFAHSRGDWSDDGWKGWWGDTPPYHCPVFVLTHYARAPVEMNGGTVFHFVTEGAEEALRLAREAAGDRDIRVGGGAATIREYLTMGAIDEVHLAISPVVLGGGEALFAGLDLPALGYAVSQQALGENATHIILTKQ